MKPYDETQFQDGMNTPPIPPQQGEEFISDEELMQPQEKKNNTWQYVAIGGTAALLLGVGVAYAATQTGEESEVDTDAVQDAFAEPETHHTEHHHTTYQSRMHNTLTGDMRVAHVSDSMTFNDAFASARAQVGPGGIFEWRGGIYGTYTADEWNAMSDEEHDLFAMRTHETDIYGGDFDTASTRVDNDGNIEPIKSDVDVVYHGSERVDWSDGTAYRVEFASVDGHDASFFDVNADGQNDYYAINANDNDRWDNGEVFDARTGQVMRGVNGDNMSERLGLNHDGAEITSAIYTDSEGVVTDLLTGAEYEGSGNSSVIAANNEVIGSEGDDPDYNNNLEVLAAEKGDNMGLAASYIDSEGEVAGSREAIDYTIYDDNGDVVPTYPDDSASLAESSADSGMTVDGEIYAEAEAHVDHTSPEDDYMAYAGGETTVDSYAEATTPAMDTAVDSGIDYSGADDFSAADAGMEMM